MVKPRRNGAENVQWRMYYQQMQRGAKNRVVVLELACSVLVAVVVLVQ